ncbi:MAG: CYTH and CHAD domain-containing protein [Ornithinimicrobium sp.]
MREQLWAGTVNKGRELVVLLCAHLDLLRYILTGADVAASVQALSDYDDPSVQKVVTHPKLEASAAGTILKAMTVHDEVEITFLADLGRDLPEVLAQVERDIPGVLVLATGEPFTLEATYFDTADLRLARANLTLRRRLGGEDQGWHLKVPAGEDTRTEVQLPLSRARKTVPAALRRMVWARSLGEPLVAVAKIETHRTAYLVAAREKNPLLEVADDTVTASRLFDGPDERDGETLRWREVEVEVKEGTTELLAEVAESMQQSGLRFATGASRAKVLRVLDIPPETEPAVLSDRSSAGEVVMAYTAQQVEQIRLFDPLVRLDHPDSVHKMRVATRRLRSTLKTFRPVFDRSVTEPLRSEVKWLAEHLGRARDAEVLRERLMSSDGQDLTSDVDVPVLRHAAEGFRGTYEAEHGSLVQHLKSERYHALMVSLVALAEDPPLTERALQPAGEVLPRRVRKAYRAVQRSVAVAADSPVNTRDQALHDVRKAAKRARYAAEAVTPVSGEPATEFALIMEQIQGDLGEHQDSVVMRDVLRQCAFDDGDSDPERAFAYGRRDAQEQARGHAAERAFTKSWSSLKKRKKKRLLGWTRKA